MTWNAQAEFDKQLQWLIHLAQQPAWKLYAWEAAKELDAEDSGLFKGMADALVKAMKHDTRD